MEVVEVLVPLVVDDARLCGCHEGSNLGRLDIGGDVDRFELRVDVMLGGIPVGIGRFRPAVVVDGGVERLRAVGDVVAQPACLKQDDGLDTGQVLIGCAELAVVAKVGFQAFPYLFDLPGLKANLGRGERQVRMLLLCCFECLHELEPAAGKHTPVRAAARGTSRARRTGEIGPLKVEEVIGRLRVVQFIFRLVAPLIGFGALVLNDVGRVAVAKKSRHIRRQTFDGKAIDHAVAIATPGVGRGYEKQCRQGACGKAGERAERRHCREYSGATKKERSTIES